MVKEGEGGPGGGGEKKAGHFLHDPRMADAKSTPC